MPVLKQILRFIRIQFFLHLSQPYTNESAQPDIPTQAHTHRFRQRVPFCKRFVYVTSNNKGLQMGHIFLLSSTYEKCIYESICTLLISHICICDYKITSAFIAKYNCPFPKPNEIKECGFSKSVRLFILQDVIFIHF